MCVTTSKKSRPTGGVRAGSEPFHDRNMFTVPTGDCQRKLSGQFSGDCREGNNDSTSCLPSAAAPAKVKSKSLTPIHPGILPVLCLPRRQHHPPLPVRASLPLQGCLKTKGYYNAGQRTDGKEHESKARAGLAEGFCRYETGHYTNQDSPKHTVSGIPNVLSPARALWAANRIGRHLRRTSVASCARAHRTRLRIIGHRYSPIRRVGGRLLLFYSKTSGAWGRGQTFTFHFNEVLDSPTSLLCKISMLFAWAGQLRIFCRATVTAAGLISP